MAQDYQKIYLELQQDQQQLLNRNGVTIEEVLRQQNLPVQVSYCVALEEGEARSKDPAMIILASGAMALAVGTAISKVLHTLHRRPQLVEYYDLIELRDAEGKVLLNEYGQPKWQRVKKYELLEPRQENRADSMEIGFKPDKGIIIKFSAKSEQPK